jgi:hypothetical protein
MVRLDADVVVIGAGPAGTAAADGEDMTSGEVLAPATQADGEGTGGSAAICRAALERPSVGAAHRAARP